MSWMICFARSLESRTVRGEGAAPRVLCLALMFSKLQNAAKQPSGVVVELLLSVDTLVMRSNPLHSIFTFSFLHLFFYHTP